MLKRVGHDWATEDTHKGKKEESLKSRGKHPAYEVKGKNSRINSKKAKGKKAEINDKESKYTLKKMNKAKIWCFGNVIDKIK